MATVSTIIPVYNGETTVVEAIESALSQSFRDQEVIVVNDGSSDSTSEILASYGERIRVISQVNGGVGKARNAGVAASSGKYIAFLDSDDIWLPGKLAAMVAALEPNPQASLAFSDFFRTVQGAKCDQIIFRSVDHARAERLRSEPFRVFSLFILPSVWMIPRRIFELDGGFCKQLEQFKGAGGYLDQWMLLLLREMGKFVHVPEKLCVYRSPESHESPDKYELNLALFIALAKEHYGIKSKPLIRAARNALCRSLLTKVAHQMDRRDHSGAVCSLAQIARSRSLYFLSSEFIERLFVLHNIKRARNLLLYPSASNPLRR